MTIIPELNLDSFKRLKDANSLLFLSAKPKEGTTTIVLSAGEAIKKRLNNRILYIDTNFRNPDLHRRLSLASSPGLSDYLSRTDLSLISCIKKNDIGDHLMPIGSQPSFVAKNLSSDRFSYMIKEACTMFDQVLVDANTVSDSYPAKDYYACFDAAFLIVECETTRWEVVQNAKEIISIHRSSISGVILNKRRLYIPRWLYNII